MSKQNKTIVVGINSLVSTVHPAYSNHIQLFYRLGRSYPEYNFCLVNPPRMSIDRMRNYAAAVALEVEATHLLFIDDDVLIPSPFDFLHKLLRLKVPIAAADVFIRGYPFNHMFFRYNKDKSGLNPVSADAKLKPIEYVDAVGFSCCLIETHLLKQLQTPYFITGLTNTEDIYFCLKAREYDKELPIVVDTSIQCAHILWNECIEMGNVKAYKKYYEALNGKPDKEAEFRGQNYYNLMKSSTGQVSYNEKA